MKQTGTFDDWKKTVKLDKKDTVHEKLVNLPTGSDKIFYKVRHDQSARIPQMHMAAAMRLSAAVALEK